MSAIVIQSTTALKAEKFAWAGRRFKSNMLLVSTNSGPFKRYFSWLTEESKPQLVIHQSNRTVK